MEHIDTLFYCEQDKIDIGNGMCCFVCSKRERPKEDEIKHDHQMCKYERITGTRTWRD